MDSSEQLLYKMSLQVRFSRTKYERTADMHGHLDDLFSNLQFLSLQCCKFEVFSYRCVDL